MRIKFEHMIIQLSSITFPEGTFSRDYVVPHAVRSSDDAAHYDRQCLTYDVFYDFSTMQIILLCPKLVNFENIIRSATITSSYGLHRIQKIQKHRLYDVVYLMPTPRPERVDFCFKVFKINVEIKHDVQDFLSGCRAVVAISKNNNLQWIRDWAEFYSKYHGADAVLLFDNDSSIYKPKDIRRMLSTVNNIKKVVIVQAPFKYGPRLNRSKEKFLQESLLNLGRIRFLNKCRSVLSVDIDELVICKGDKSIFEITERSIFGYTLFFESWRYAATISDDIRHKDHCWKSLISHKNPKTKYCIDPKGLLASKSWSVHSIRGIPQWLQRVMHTRSAQYLHCRQISTNWHYNRVENTPALVQDSRAAQVLSKIFREP